MFACLHVPDFPVQAALLPETQDAREGLRQSPIAVFDGPASLPKIIALNGPARHMGIEAGMTRLQVETCGGVLLRKRSEADENFAQAELLECANAFSPTVESTCSGTVILDLAGTEKLFGALEDTAQKLAESAMERGFHAHVAVASNPDTAFYAALASAGITLIPAGDEADRLARLRISLLPITPDMLETLESWGIRTFQSLAALPEAPLTERLGQDGLYLQRLARGQIMRPLVPSGESPHFVETHEFDDPVETLESLSFIVNRLLQQACSRLTAHALSTNELRLILNLDVRQVRAGKDGEEYKHEWKLPVPTQDRSVLFTLVRLDLEKQTFSAPVKKVTVEVVPAKPRAIQGNLFAPPSPEAEQLEITLARIRGVVGSSDEDGLSRVGSPELVDTHQPDSFRVRPFSSSASTNSATVVPAIALRVFRPAQETSVERTGEAPHLVRLGRKYRRVLAASGPWCSSGNWWKETWVREEWDVALKTTAGIGFYRIYLDRLRDRWFVEGIFD